MKKGFTLVEMLVVIGIIAALIAASLVGYSSMLASAERTKAQELVSNVATALTAIFDADGIWPKSLRTNGGTGGPLDENAAYVLGSRGYLSLTRDDSNKKLAGVDRFGIVTPWATAVIKNRGSSASLSTIVSGDKTIKDHQLQYAIDLDGDGIINDVSVGGESISVRATAIVWCAGKDGKMEAYSKGLKSDDVYSWNVGQTRNVK